MVVSQLPNTCACDLWIIGVSGRVSVRCFTKVLLFAIYDLS